MDVLAASLRHPEQVINPVVTVAAFLIANIGVPVAILAITFSLARWLSTRLNSALPGAYAQQNIAILLTRTLWVAVWTLGILSVLKYFGFGATPLAAFIGVAGLAASLSLQQVLQNLVAGFYLLAERPFKIGDTVLVIGPAGLNHEGEVEDIQLRTTHLRSRDDELILIPNASVFSGVITNRTAVGGYATQVSVTFPRTLDPLAVEQILLPALQRIENVKIDPPPEIRVDSVTKDSWTACLTFWTTMHRSKSKVIWEICQAIPEATINDPGTPA